MPQLTDDIMLELLPPPPPERLLPGGVERESVEARRQNLDELRRNAFDWCAALQTFAERADVGRRLAGFRFVTFGFIPLIEEEALRQTRSQGGYVFGVAVELGPAGERAEQDFAEIRLLGETFAVVLNRRPHQLHVANPTSRRWLQDRRGAGH